jgi:hypothetical protein
MKNDYGTEEEDRALNVLEEILERKRSLLKIIGIMVEKVKINNRYVCKN